eukprot:CAMPEP_0194761566 /NCGR_PEP_ID=MMETSP0323_2-20130528/14250_1 /TAXON_ID=2866 ORGANISM="Crypthecodinium cohnii, Strain Seligo" /NCGR_SAMPLE_ID=MMETSP0323_2 /ASSEMBLY_ACC=CAM_ASM_000346 /LENGTH=162 /DNA_ID=CAMNT_0039683361 /DNA_START=40 /DNA_END=528 /DNA_ORIENTATION=+
MKPYSFCVFAAFLAIWINSSVALQKLDDDTFEHHTQATTGSTTGSWIVSFSDTADSKMVLELDDNTEALREVYAVPAWVMRSESPQVCKRFGIKAPETWLFHKGSMYPYKGPEDGASVLKFLAEVSEGSHEGIKKKTPPEPTIVDVIKEKVLGMLGMKSDEL